MGRRTKTEIGIGILALALCVAGCTAPQSDVEKPAEEKEETEWVEIVQNGAGILAGADCEKILCAYGSLCGKKVVFPPVFGDGKAAEKILMKILNS